MAAAECGGGYGDYHDGDAALRCLRAKPMHSLTGDGLLPAIACTRRAQTTGGGGHATLRTVLRLQDG